MELIGPWWIFSKWWIGSLFSTCKILIDLSKELETRYFPSEEIIKELIASMRGVKGMACWLNSTFVVIFQLADFLFFLNIKNLDRFVPWSWNNLFRISCENNWTYFILEEIEKIYEKYFWLLWWTSWKACKCVFLWRSKSPKILFSVPAAMYFESGLTARQLTPPKEFIEKFLFIDSNHSRRLWNDELLADFLNQWS